MLRRPRRQRATGLLFCLLVVPLEKKAVVLRVKADATGGSPHDRSSRAGRLQKENAPEEMPAGLATMSQVLGVLLIQHSALVWQLVVCVVSLGVRMTMLL